MLAVAIFVCLGWILSICLHEYGHAIVAYWGGDTSVKDKGYLTLNPLKYADINLSLILPLIFLLIGGIALPGAAVYIDRRRLRNCWWQSAVSAAGPIVSAIATLLLAILFQISLAWQHNQYWWLSPALAFLIHLEIFLIIFNSLPIPPLDGYGVIEPWLPSQLQLRSRRFSGSALILLFTLLWYAKPLSMFFSSLSTAIAQLLGVSPEMIFEGFILFNKSPGILLLLAISVVLFISRVTRKLHERWDEKGNALSNTGRYEKAIAAYDNALQTKPDHYEIWYKRGKLLSVLNRDEEAIASYDKAIKIKPDDDEAWYEKGLALTRLQRYEEAIASYDQAIKINPELDRYWHYRGIALFSVSQFEEAIASYDRAIQIQPNSPNSYEVWYNRGLALNYSRHYEEAIASYDKAIQVKPNLELAWHYRGMALYLLHRHEEAIASYDRAIQIKPDFAQAWTHQGGVLLALQRYKEALSSYGQAIRIKPDDPAAWTDRGQALTKLQKYEEAINSCERAIKLKPDYELAWLNRGIALEKMHCFKEAFDSYEKIIKIKPGNCAYSWAVQGRALGRLQRYEEAIAACDKAIQVDPEYAFAWYNKACCYAKQNIIDLAIENLKQAINFDPYEVRGEAITDSSFDSIRAHRLFKDLIDADCSY